MSRTMIGLDEPHFVTCLYRSRAFDHSVYAYARELAYSADLNPVVLGERAENVAISWKLILGERRHHASRIGHHDAQFYPITDHELAAHPVVLNEPGLFRTDDHVHPEPALVEAALRPEFAQSLEG